MGKFQDKQEGTAPSKRRRYPFTMGLIALCIFLFLVNTMQQFKLFNNDGMLGVQLGMTPLQQHLMFDYSKSRQAVDAFLQDYSVKSSKDLEALPSSQLAQFKKATEIPAWEGVLPRIIDSLQKKPPPEKPQGPLFEKIREGELWRLFTPALLHGGLLHILFNMIWVWLLLPSLEERLSTLQLTLLIVILAVVTNVAQYLITGPMFLGFSGVIVGLVGFIWVRQKKAPWEGYPLPRTTILFIVIFVLAMLLMEIITITSSLLFAKQLSANIANTAHIVGGAVGALLALSPLFSRRVA